MIGAIQTALSGLQAASTRAAASADNIANIDTTGSLDGTGQAPYNPVSTVQQTAWNGQSVTASNVPVSPGFVPAFDPNSPFADKNGLIGVPNVDLAGEIVNLDIAKTAYKANAIVIRTVGEMQDDLLKSFDKKA